MISANGYYCNLQMDMIYMHGSLWNHHDDLKKPFCLKNLSITTHFPTHNNSSKLQFSNGYDLHAWVVVRSSWSIFFFLDKTKSLKLCLSSSCSTSLQSETNYSSPCDNNNCKVCRNINPSHLQTNYKGN